MKEKVLEILNTQFPYIPGAWKDNLAEQIRNALPDDKEVTKRTVEKFISSRPVAFFDEQMEGLDRLIDWLDEKEE